jgi:hypothetical protein
MIPTSTKKITRGCIFLNRSYVRWQHALVLDLKNRYGVDKWCGYGYGQAAAEINQTQKEINYEPLLIDDYLFIEAQDEIVDEEFLNTKEKEYGHPYWWQEFINDRFTSINWPRQFYPVFNPTLTHYEIKQQFQYRIKKIEEMFDKAKPDFVLFADAGALGVNLLYYIAKKRGIPTIVLTFTRFSGLSGFTDNLFGTFNKMEEIFHEIESGMHDSPKKLEAIEFIEQFRNKPVRPEYISSEFWNKSKQSLIKQFVLFSKNLVRKCIDMFDRSFPKVYNYSPIDFIRHNFLFWLNSHRVPRFDIPDYNEDYAFYALTCEPELSLLMQAPYFSDQAWVAQAIARSLPLNFKLYIKEHPSMVGYRNPKFYKEIRKFPNVRLIDTRMDAMPIVKNAKLVFTITGTVGLEATFYKKPVVTFGLVNYNVMPQIYKCRTPDELPIMVKRALESHKHSEEELADFMSALFEDSFKVDLTKLISETDLQKVKQNPDISILSDQTMKYLANYNK